MNNQPQSSILQLSLSPSRDEVFEGHRHPVLVTVTLGTAWITQECLGEDVVLHAGEQRRFAPRKRLIISSIRGDARATLTFFSGATACGDLCQAGWLARSARWLRGLVLIAG